MLLGGGAEREGGRDREREMHLCLRRDLFPGSPPPDTRGACKGSLPLWTPSSEGPMGTSPPGSEPSCCAQLCFEFLPVLTVALGTGQLRLCVCLSVCLVHLSPRVGRREFLGLHWAQLSCPSALPHAPHGWRPGYSIEEKEGPQAWLLGQEGRAWAPRQDWVLDPGSWSSVIAAGPWAAPALGGP